MQKLFDVTNTIVRLFRNGFIVHSEYQSNVKLKSKPKPEESIAERTKLKRQMLDEIPKKEKTISLKIFRHYFDYISPTDMYMALHGSKKLGRK